MTADRSATQTLARAGVVARTSTTSDARASGASALDFDARRRALGRHLAASFVAVALMCGRFAVQSDWHDAVTAVYVVFLWASYSAIYSLPAHALVLGVHRLVSPRDRARALTRTRALVVTSTAVAATTATWLALYADARLFQLFGFHANGFVWNLLVTPGGLESLGASPGAAWVWGLAAAGVLIASALTLRMSWRAAARSRPSIRSRKRMWAIAATVVTTSLIERAMFGVARAQGRSTVLCAAEAFPLHQPTSARGLAHALGIEVVDEERISIHASRALAYPRAELYGARPAQPLNVVWLVSESLRWDQLTPEVMPATSAFASRATRFAQHFSGGNGTRWGMFSMFYGLHGAYWFSFLDARRGPVLFDWLARCDYQLSVQTSAKFTYPEFDRTVFANVPRERMRENSLGEKWQRDRANVDELLDFIDGRDPTRPFFAFQFFEAPHAPYTFPPECAIRTPYAEDLNYATMDVERDAAPMFNRYVNACRFLDGELARVFERLAARDLLERTIVVVTGDHGEEFMEHGRWGHNSAFSDEQLRVPLVLWIPGQPAGEVERITSHVDLIPTLLPLLGVENSPTDYSLGNSLFSARARDSVVVCDWSSIGLVDAEHTARFPISWSSAHGTNVMTRGGVDADEAAYRATHGAAIADLFRDLAAFRRVRAGRIE